MEILAEDQTFSLNSKLESKTEFLAKIWNFGLNFWEKTQTLEKSWKFWSHIKNLFFLTKILTKIFDKNLYLFIKLLVLFCTTICIFDQNFYCSLKFLFLTRIFIFWPQFRFFEQIFIFCLNFYFFFKFLSLTKIFIFLTNFFIFSPKFLFFA